HDDAAAELTGRGAWVDHRADVEHADPARHPHLAGVGIHPDFAELRTGCCSGSPPEIARSSSEEGQHVRLVHGLDVVTAGRGEDVGVSLTAMPVVEAAVAGFQFR